MITRTENEKDCIEGTVDTTVTTAEFNAKITGKIQIKGRDYWTVFVTYSSDDTENPGGFGQLHLRMDGDYLFAALKPSEQSSYLARKKLYDSLGWSIVDTIIMDSCLVAPVPQNVLLTGFNPYDSTRKNAPEKMNVNGYSNCLKVIFKNQNQIGKSSSKTEGYECWALDVGYVYGWSIHISDFTMGSYHTITTTRTETELVSFNK